MLQPAMSLAAGVANLANAAQAAPRVKLLPVDAFTAGRAVRQPLLANGKSMSLPAYFHCFYDPAILGSLLDVLLLPSA